MAGYHQKKTLRLTIAKCNERNRAWRGKVMEYARQLLGKLNRGDRRRLEALLGRRPYPGPIRASDLAATRAFGLICIDVVHSFWLAVKGLRWFHVTLIADEFHVSERKPAVALKRLKGKAYKEIQELGLNGLIWVDVDPLPNHPQGGHGGTFLFHVHALCFTDKRFDVAAARQKLKKSRSWSCCLGAEPTTLVIKPRMGTAAWWAQYGSKPPHRAKNCIVQPDGSVKLWWTDKGYRAQTAMRLAEGLAQIALLDTLIGVGEGKDLREDIRRKLMNWHRKRWRDERPVRDFDVRAFCRRLWRVTRVIAYKSWRIIGASV
jgi:hypothetical protein